MYKTLQMFSGDDWEEFCLWLLQDRHGALAVQKVPAADKGDLGVDYYCFDEGVVYQCYAVEEPVSITQRADKQKAKMTVDLGKLRDNADEISQLLHGKLIRNWVMLVPNHDSKQVNLHAAKKTADMKMLALPHLDPDFCVIIQDLDAFSPSSLEKRTGERQIIQFAPVDVAPDDIAQFSESQPPELLQNLYHKLAKRVADGSASVDQVAAHLLEELIRRDNVLENLRIAAPELYEKVQGSIRRRLRYLQTMGTPTGPAQTILSSQFEELCADIRTALPNLSTSDAEMVAYGTIGSWLMLCPLDFPPYENAA